jgi:hypothetical protein
MGGNALYIVSIQPCSGRRYELFAIAQKILTPEQLRARNGSDGRSGPLHLQPG